MKRSKLTPNFFQSGGYSPVQLSNSEFIPTYAGAPLAEGDKYAQGIADLYHKNITDLTKLDILNASRKVAEGDREESEKYNQYLKSQMEALAKQGDYENMTMKVNSLARDFYNDPKLKLMSENEAAISEMKNYNEKLRLSGKSVLFEPDYKNFKSVQYDEKGNPVYNTFQNTSEEEMDYQKRRQSIWNEVQGDGGQLTGKELTDNVQAIAGYIATGQWKGLTTDKISKKVEHALKVYEGTAEYGQEVRKYTAAFMEENSDLSPESALAKAKAKVKENIISEGMLKEYIIRDPAYLQNWILKEQMDNAGKSQESVFTRGDDLGVRPENTIGKIVDSYNRISAGQTKNPIIDQEYHARGEGYDAASWANSNTHYTPEEEQQWYTLARAAVKWKYKDEKENPLDQFYKGDPAKDEKAEKEFLKQPEVYAAAQEFQQYMQERMKFPVKQDYNYYTVEGRNQAEGDLKDFKNNWAYYNYMNLDTNETFSAKDGKSFNDKFKEAIPDLSKVTVSGVTGPVNPYAFITNKPEFADAVYLTYNDGEGNVGRFLMARPKSRQNNIKQIASDLWMSGIQQPFTPVTKTIKYGGKDISVVYEDQDDKGILIRSVNNHPINVALPKDDYALALEGILQVGLN